MSIIKFNSEKFSVDLKGYRANRSQQEIADELGIHRSTLSQLENGKLIPSLENLRVFCEKTNKKFDSYFLREEQDPVLLMMGKMKGSDKENLMEVLNRISIRQKYIAINKRCAK